VSKSLKEVVDLEKRLLSQVFSGPASILVALRGFMNQAINCYATTSPEHTIKLLVRMAAHIEAHFEAIDEKVLPALRSDIVSLPQGMLLLDKAIRHGEEAISRGGVGDAKGHVMNALGILITILVRSGEYTQ